MDKTNIAFVIAGPTASGKSGFALQIAKNIISGGGKCCIINADASQIYNGVNVLTACPDDADFAVCPHKLYSFVNIGDSFCVADWLKLTALELADCKKNSITPIIVGGSTMYIRALIDGISEIPDISESVKQNALQLMDKIGKDAFFEELTKIDANAKSSIKPKDKQRMMRRYCVAIQTGHSIDFFCENKTDSVVKNWQTIKIKLMPERSLVYENCNKRFETMLQNGAVDEVKNASSALRDVGNVGNAGNVDDLPAVCKNISDIKIIGMREIAAYINGDCSYAAMVEASTQATRNYAKRQYTWLKNKFDDFIAVENPYDLDIIKKLMRS